MTTTAAPRIRLGIDAPARGRRVLVWLGSGWVPAALAATATLATLHAYGVSWWDLAVYVVFLVVAVTVPGMLIWRAANRRPRCLAEDVAAGTAVGFAIEVLTYLSARAVDAPLLVLAWPVVTLVVFARHPGLRRHWRSTGEVERAPTWWSWTLAVLFGGLLLFTCTEVFRHSGVTPPEYLYADGDMPFHLANIGEVKHHVPPHVPYVLGESLHYHWFVYAEMAATNWVTGVESLVLLRRLSLVPYLAVALVLVAVAARRLTGQWWAGPAAVVGTYFVLAPHPYDWRLRSWLAEFGFGVVDDGSLLRQNLFSSPTQTFAAAVFAAALLLLLDGLRGPAQGWPAFLVLAVLVIVVMGAKATFLPLLGAGLVAVVAVEAARGRFHRYAVTCCMLTGACLAFAQLVLFGGSAQGVHWAPLGSTDRIGLRAETGIPLVGLLAIILVCLAFVWGGIAVLVRDGRILRPDLVLLVGVGVAAVLLSYLFDQAGFSNTFFLQSGRACLSLAAVCGLAVLLRRGNGGAVAIAGVCCGALAIFALRAMGPSTMPTLGTAAGKLGVMLALVWPYVVLAAFIAVGATVLGPRRAGVFALAGALGAGLVSGVYDRVVDGARAATRTGWQAAHPWPATVAVGTLEAGRWLRDHSSPSDLVATNAHCSPPPADSGRCAVLHFAVSAFTERRVLVEGWGYTARANATGRDLGVPLEYVGFHDPQRLADNDAAFSRPSEQTLSLLRDRYGVRWLFVERNQNLPALDLDRFATLRFTSGECAVYEIPR